MRHLLIPAVLAGALLTASCQAEPDILPEPELSQSASSSPTSVSASVTSTVTSTSSEPRPLPENVVTHGDNAAEDSEITAAPCGNGSGMEAVRANLDQLPDEQWPWDAQWADISGYDPCAALSWAVVPIEGGTASSPYHIMLFHQGEYLGTATAKAYGFSPKVDRTDDASLAVTYTYQLPGDSVALASGRAYATFRWDEGQQRVIMTGDVPPV